MSVQENFKADTTFLNKNQTASKAFSAAFAKERTSTPSPKPTPTTTSPARKEPSKKHPIACPECSASATVLSRLKCGSSTRTSRWPKETASNIFVILDVAWNGCPASRTKSPWLTPVAALSVLCGWDAGVFLEISSPAPTPRYRSSTKTNR